MTTFKEIVEVEKKAHKSLSSYETRVLKNFEKEKIKLKELFEEKKIESKNNLTQEYNQKELEVKKQAESIILNAKQLSEDISNQDFEEKAKNIVEGVMKYV